MFLVSAISVSYPGKELFTNVSFLINPRDRIGLVGKNGSGKTTVLDIIAGIKKADTGNVVIPEGKTIGYLQQELKTDSTLSVFDEAASAFHEVIAIEKEIEKLNKLITETKDFHSPAYLKNLELLNHKYDRYNYLDGNKRLYNLGKVLKGLGFSDEDFDRKVSEFSGGWQMRITLAKLLLKKPDLILLDEPTNHLDIESILWLEDFLINYPGAVVIVSHDRMFLDNICRRTIEIVYGKVYDYPVKYSDFIIIREEKHEAQINAAKNQARFIQEQERFIRTFKAKSTKAKQVQSRIKKLEKMDRIEMDDFDHSSINFRFPDAPKSGRIVVHAENVSKNYGEKNILKDLNFYIEQGDRVSFVGRNGEGKTTLVKMIAGLVDYSGDLKTGYNVIPGYYAQVQEKTLDETNTVIKTLENIAGEEWNNTRIRSLLGTFLFGEQDVDKKVKVLSGGEKSRLALARLLLRPANFLILDEPTNHLDISAKEVLKKALLKFSGTMIVVSHDRDFLKGLTTRTFEFRDHRIREYPGGIDEFLSKHKVETFREFEQLQSAGKTKQSSEQPEESRKEKYQQKKEEDRDFKKLKRDLKKCEDEIEKTELKIKELELLLHTPEVYSDKIRSKQIIESRKEQDSLLEGLLEKWEDLHNKVENSGKSVPE